jgi:phage baseplate assembly protein W
MAIKDIISRRFKDISLSFSRNPLTNDIIPIFNEDAIKKSVVNLVRTQLSEKFFNPLIGSSITSALFEIVEAQNTAGIENEIETLLNNYEPRIKLISISVSLSEDSENTLIVEITYNIVGLPVPQQTVEFILEPTRI